MGSSAAHMNTKVRRIWMEPNRRTPSKAFPPWTGQGKVLYKIRPHTLSPEHFYQSTDEGTVAVRYIVQPLTPSGTRLRIDAVFVEATLRKRHASNGRVEGS